MTPWWEAAFTEDYLAVYAHRTEAQGAAEIAGLLPHLHGPVLDACCGGGRHLAALRAAGLPAVGFDLSPALLAQARSRGPVARADVRCPPFAAGSFQHVLLLFTAFGYFDDETNAAVLAGLGRLLMPGGTLVLDLPDPQRLRSSLVPHSHRVTAGGLTIVEERRLTATRVEKTVTITHLDGRVRTYTESVRLYDDLRPWAQRAGLRVSACWTSLTGGDGDRRVWWLTTGAG